jgi:single-stranded-DNA-specific exonuclease
LNVEEKNALSPHSDLLAHLLFHRGITDSDAAGKFLAPDYDRDTHDPFLLKDSDKAAARIIHAIQAGEKIAVYADYDADGIPGAALFNDLFTRIGYKNFVIYIPHRHHEGFGLHEKAVEELASSGVKLIVTVDCGISDGPVVEHARELGVDVIITDHHEPPEDGPKEAVAVIDPKQHDCKYPDKNLCGTGVAFKLIQAILATNRFGLKEGMEKWMLDLVGIATLSDMVPLTGENRVFAHYGMTVLRKTQRLGLRRLFAKLKLSQPHLTEDDITFMITPRINAASRMGVPMDAFNLLAANDEESARAGADHLDAINNERKGVVASLVKEVKKIVRERHGSSMPGVIVLGNPEWRPSLLGLAANSCAEEFRRPVFLWGRDGEDLIKGSCRSEGRSSVVELMRAVPTGVFTEFGGHRHSGGFSVGNEAIHFLEKHLNDSAANIGRLAGTSATDADGIQEFVDSELSMDDVTPRMHDDINRLAPFGLGNPKPLFVFRNVKPISVRRFGKGNDHMELVFQKSGGQKVSAIAFFGAVEDWAQTTEAGTNVDLIASVEKSMFRGRTEFRLRVVDVVRV